MPYKNVNLKFKLSPAKENYKNNLSAVNLYRCLIVIMSLFYSGGCSDRVHAVQGLPQEEE